MGLSLMVISIAGILLYAKVMPSLVVYIPEEWL